MRAIARFVPAPIRASWRNEWEAEFDEARRRDRLAGVPGWRTAFRLWSRCGGAIGDAWWLRRRHRSVPLFRVDVRNALRDVRRRPTFGGMVIVTLGIGIGGATAIFSVIDPLLWRDLPYPQADRLVEVFTVHPDGNAYEGVHPVVWRALRDAAPNVFDRFEAGAPRSTVITGSFAPEYVRAHALTSGMFELLGATPLLGRVFDESDEGAGATPVALVSERFWRRAFASESDVLGESVTFGGVTFTVIGVMPESFRFPIGTVELWFPLRPEDPLFPWPGYEAVARLGEGVTMAAAQARADALASRREADAQEAFFWDLAVQPLGRSVSRSAGSALSLLAGAVLCVLLIACANAANLLLVRGSQRQAELAVRRSLGASGPRLFRQLVTESLVLSLCGGLLGMALAWLGVRGLADLMPASLVDEAQARIGVDGRVMLFGFLLSLITGFVFGAGPALRAARQVQITRASARTMTASAAAHRAGGVLVVAELALSMALLVGAGLIGRSFARLVSADPGFEPAGLIVANLSLPTHRYNEEARVDAFYAELRERLLASPGVSAVSISDAVPPTPGTLQPGRDLEVEGGVITAPPPWVPAAVVDDQYFDVLGIPIRAGRSFGPEDSRGSERVAVIDTDLATFLWPDASPLGKRFRMRPGEPWITVIGVAGEVRLSGPDDRRSPFEVYLSSSQQTPWRYRAIAMRGASPATVATAFREAVRAIDPEQPVLAITDGESRFGSALDRHRFVLLLMGVFTAVALALAAIGTYGVAAFLVAQRRREIGLRIALGAAPRSVVRNVVVRGLWQAGAGALAGALLALSLSRFLAGLLYGVRSSDPITLASVGALLGVVAVVACLVPALRAGRVSPLEAMRVD